MGIEHKGICRFVDHFRQRWLEEMARESETRLRADFEPFGATRRVRAVQISHIASVGEGIGLDLAPHDPKEWAWWGCFEADVEIARRPRFGATWTELMSRGDVGTWIDATAYEYLRILRAGRDSYPDSLLESG